MVSWVEIRVKIIIILIKTEQFVAVLVGSLDIFNTIYTFFNSPPYSNYNYQSININSVNLDGDTLLNLGIWQNYLTSIAVNSILKASSYGNLDIVNTIIVLGGSVNIYNKLGKTALMLG